MTAATSSETPLWLTLWDVAARIISGPILARRLARGKEDATRIDERRGLASQPRPPGPLLWFHAASVGEALSVMPLIAELTTKGYQILVTSGTRTSAELLATRLPQGARHQFVPVDRRDYVSRFLDHWRPDAAFFVDSELWPHLIMLTAARGCPLFLLNGRMSEKSFHNWRRFGAIAGKLMAAFTLIFAGDRISAEHFRYLGARDVRLEGNLKFDSKPETGSGGLKDFAPSPRLCWMAASTHADEELMIGWVHQSLNERFPTLLTVIVPRHPERGVAIAAGLQAMGLKAARRAAGEPLTDATSIYIADTLGELPQFFQAVSLVFMGKSLAAQVSGGQNPMEAAAAGAAILTGPRTENFQEAVALLEDAGGLVVVRDEAALAREAARLLANPQAIAKMGAQGKQAVESQAGATARILAILAPLLPKVTA